MNKSLPEVIGLVCAMGAVIFFCRAFPFLFFSGVKFSQSKGSQSKRIKAFLDFVERIAPPAAMTVLAFNALGISLRNLIGAIGKMVLSVSPSPGQTEFRTSLAALIAAAITALIHLWKRNPLISIFGGTALYMILFRVLK